MQVEVKLASELEKVTHSQSLLRRGMRMADLVEHNAAVSKVQTTGNDANNHTSQHQRAAQEVEQKKVNLQHVQAAVSRQSCSPNHADH